MNKPSEEAPEALYQHCETTYKGMLQQAEGKLMFDEDAQEERVYVIWEGMLTQFITGQLNLSVPYYTYITRALKRMGCIRQIKRGGGTAPSMWELIKEPTYDLYMTTIAPKRPPQDRYAALEQRLNDHGNRLKVLEHALSVIIQEEADKNG